MARLGPVTLEGTHVRLEPVRPVHREGLLAAAQAAEIWTWLPNCLMSEEAMDAFISEALDRERHGSEFAFAVVLQEGGRVVGSTRYMDVQAVHRGVEIGSTWYTPEVWGNVVNSEAKFLLLQHAFEVWSAIRVALKTDAHNARSQAAIRKLGAKYEGTLRNHRIRRDGTLRDTVMFSITREEWPTVKATLAQRVKPEPGDR